MRPWILFLIVAGVSSCFSQEKGEFHVFTDKKGNTIPAKILSVADSRKMAEIEREVGKTFSIEITTFSLEDQQYLRNWLGLSSRARSTGLGPREKGRLRVFGSLRKGASFTAGRFPREGKS